MNNKRTVAREQTIPTRLIGSKEYPLTGHHVNFEVAFRGQSVKNPIDEPRNPVDYLLLYAEKAINENSSTGRRP